MEQREPLARMGTPDGDGYRNASVIIEEDIPADFEPTDEEVLEYAKWLGIDIQTEASLLWIAREGIKASLPPDWKPCKSSGGEIYYFNFSSGESRWEHPQDEHFKELYRRERERLLTPGGNLLSLESYASTQHNGSNAVFNGSNAALFNGSSTSERFDGSDPGLFGPSVVKSSIGSNANGSNANTNGSNSSVGNGSNSALAQMEFAKLEEEHARATASDIVALETASAARVEEKRHQIAEDELRLKRALQEAADARVELMRATQLQREAKASARAAQLEDEALQMQEAAEARAAQIQEETLQMQEAAEARAAQLQAETLQMQEEAEACAAHLQSAARQRQEAAEARAALLLAEERAREREVEETFARRAEERELARRKREQEQDREEEEEKEQAQRELLHARAHRTRVAEEKSEKAGAEDAERLRLLQQVEEAEKRAAAMAAEVAALRSAPNAPPPGEKQKRAVAWGTVSAAVAGGAAVGAVVAMALARRSA